MVSRQWWLPIGAIFLISCAADPKSPTAPDDSEPDPSATYSRVESEIFVARCAYSGCHGAPAPAQGLDLRAGHAYTSLVNVSAKESNLKRVEPGRPDDSYIVHKTLGTPGITGERMPLGGPYLTADEQQLLIDWIRRGAPND